MSETWQATRTSIDRFLAGWREAEEDTRARFRYWATGILLMGGAIISQFGWSGFVFCLGLVLWAAGNSNK